ncbi:MAG: hypothetical protein ACLGIZ_07865 [Acidimicrobiia bacterium]
MAWFRSAARDEGTPSPSFEERLAQISPGVPGRCPACDGLGYLDNIDIAHRYQIQHCKDCLHRWEYLFDDHGKVVGLTELDADGRPVTRSRVRPTRPAPVLPTEPAPVDAGNEIVDVRDEAVAAPDELDLTEPSQLTPAAWLRRTLRH